jgi:phosphate uptake regulator
MLFFKELYELWRRDNSLTQALNESYVMLEDTRDMFKAAGNSLRYSLNGEIEINIYEKDQKINAYQQKVRRKVLKHLAITGGANIIPGLVLTSIVIDIERIGDYAKNITELAVAHPAKLVCGSYEEVVKKIENAVIDMFDKIVPILKESDQDGAKELLQTNWWIRGKSDGILESVIQGKDTSLSCGDAAATALYARYLKRTGAHLLNITSSVINPFEKIGFWKGEET